MTTEISVEIIYRDIYNWSDHDIYLITQSSQISAEIKLTLAQPRLSLPLHPSL